MLTWPIGIFSVMLYCLLFLQINLYADTIEQGYYLGMSLYGWWFWKQNSANSDAISFSFSSKVSILKCIALSLISGIAFGLFLLNAHTTAPVIFTEPASYPMIDAITTTSSLMAMWLLSRKRAESWIYWIAVDLVAIWLYYIKDVKFLSLLYVVLLGIAINGFRTWQKGVRIS
jgi:nicotinamide mononucleotide transporter